MYFWRKLSKSARRCSVFDRFNEYGELLSMPERSARFIAPERKRSYTGHGCSFDYETVEQIINFYHFSLMIIRNVKCKQSLAIQEFAMCCAQRDLLRLFLSPTIDCSTDTTIHVYVPYSKLHFVDHRVTNTYIRQIF